MSEGLSESAIVREVAREAARRITRKVIADLRQMKDTASGDDSGLTTVWDEICVQLQGQESVLWDAYEETVRAFVCGYVAALPKHEKEAIWLQTNAGIDWDCWGPEDRQAQPVFDEDIVDWLICEFVYAEGSDWSNARIRAFLERSSRV
jgi:hypothetical protein